MDNIVALLEEAWLFPGLLQQQRKEAASREDNKVIMPNSWKKVVFLPAYLYKERVIKALSFVIG